MTNSEAPTLLCVDDEPAILDGLRRQLRNTFRVTVANSGADGLAAIEAASEPFMVIMSDMMMPEMNGAEFLRRARQAAPHSVRVLLTGQADIESAAAAVNGGAIARFLTKPCGGDDLLNTLLECVGQYSAALIEQDVLERTVRGAIEALAQTLALAAPAVFARVTRIQRTVATLIECTSPNDSWAIEVAVPLSQLGAVTLPEECLAQAETGTFTTPKERLMASKVPEISVGIINRIPRLEQVSQLITEATTPGADMDRTLPGSAILRVAFDLDVIEARGSERSDAVLLLKERLPESLHTLIDQVGAGDERPIVEIEINALVEGVQIAEDILTHNGVLLVGRGAVASPAMISRLRNCHGTGQLNESIKVRDWRMT